MRIDKRKIVDLPMVYVTGEIFLQGKRYLAAVSEANMRSSGGEIPES